MQEDKFLQAHESISKAIDVVNVSKEFAINKEEEERYEEIVDGLCDAKSLLNDLEESIKETLKNLRWYIKGTEAIDQGGSAGQDIEDIKKALDDSTKQLRDYCSDS